MEVGLVFSKKLLDAYLNASKKKKSSSLILIFLIGMHSGLIEKQRMSLNIRRPCEARRTLSGC